MTDAPFDAAPVLERLKDFQRRTVDYVFEQLFKEGGTQRFLVADEVGLGKTLVARGVIARVLERLQTGTERIDIIYICSNAAIASQNVNRLNITGERGFALASRLTLLPLTLHRLTANRINFVSFTPGTTFDLKSRGGIEEERALLYRMLAEASWNVGDGLLNLLQGSVRKRDSWKHRATRGTWPIDPDLAAAFRAAIDADTDLVARLKSCCALFRTPPGLVGPDLSNQRYGLIGDLRQRMAETCLRALEPKLVILDEFQRFKALLDGTDDGASLARALFEDKRARMLLLSATPYKMLSLDHEQDDNHYPDFLQTLSFLFNDKTRIKTIETWLKEYGAGLRPLAHGDTTQLTAVRDRLQSELLTVMCRTERVGMTTRLDAMLDEPACPAPIEPQDLVHARVADQAARAVGGREPLEYWKSSPYLLNFLKRYDLRRRIDRALDAPPAELLAALNAPGGSILRHEQLEGYEAIPAANGRMRALFKDTLDKELWRLLWMPPSLPYTVPSGPYKEIASVTKALVFSSWNLVPDAIAALATYEAERRMVTSSKQKLTHGKLYDRFKPMLRFSKGREGRLTGMPALSWLLPSVALARVVDPLAEALAAERNGRRLRHRRLEARAEAKIRALLDDLPPGGEGNRADERWYWAAPVLLANQQGLHDWIESPEGWRASDADHDAGTGFREHVAHLASACRGELILGPRPTDLPKVLAQLALAGPGTCVLRALSRIAPDVALDDRRMLTAAARVAAGFRTLFNLPETIAVLRGGKEHGYWRRALKYSLHGNLQSLLDEQVHILIEQLGLVDHAGPDRVAGVAKAIADALSIRTAQISVDELRTEGAAINRTSFNTRCRFALRFGELRDDRNSIRERADTVRTAFNSPFRPFVLASTSIGQEGLDFHTWCHAVVHWNLPSNPVDLEQREGRVHRYKGHAVRKNIAEHYGLNGLRGWSGEGDPWEALFKRARNERPAGSTDLIPFWVFEQGSARVERRVPLLPFSREVGHLDRLKRTLAVYRLVFGQPRQEDLLAYLADRLDEGEAHDLATRWRINLEPPRSTLAP